MRLFDWFSVIGPVKTNCVWYLVPVLGLIGAVVFKNAWAAYRLVDKLYQILGRA